MQKLSKFLRASPAVARRMSAGRRDTTSFVLSLVTTYSALESSSFNLSIQARSSLLPSRVRNVGWYVGLTWHPVFTRIRRAQKRMESGATGSPCRLRRPSPTWMVVTVSGAIVAGSRVTRRVSVAIQRASALPAFSSFTTPGSAGCPTLSGGTISSGKMMSRKLSSSS